MKKEYEIEALNPRRNPYAGKLKKQITINIDTAAIDYFKQMADETGIPYQTLINLYLTDCAKHNKNSRRCTVHSGGCFILQAYTCSYNPKRHVRYNLQIIQ